MYTFHELPLGCYVSICAGRAQESCRGQTYASAHQFLSTSLITVSTLHTKGAPASGHLYRGRSKWTYCPIIRRSRAICLAIIPVKFGHQVFCSVRRFVMVYLFDASLCSSLVDMSGFCMLDNIKQKHIKNKNLPPTIPPSLLGWNPTD